MKLIDGDTSLNKWEQDVEFTVGMTLDYGVHPPTPVDQRNEKRRMIERQITEKIRNQILAHIDFTSPLDVEVECCSPTLYSIKYYEIQLDIIAIYVDEETVECDELYEIVFSYDEIERIGQMAILLDEARDRWGVE